MSAVQQSPSRGRFVAFSALMWLALPLMGLRYWQVWNRLPAHMATHFDGAGRANGWMSPQVSLGFTLCVLLFMLTSFSVILFVALRRASAAEASMWAVLGLFYVIILFFLFISESVLRYNLYGSSIQVGPPVAALIIAIVVFAALYLRLQRGVAPPASDVFAEETHGSHIFAAVFAVPALAEAAAAFAIPIGGIKVALGFGAVLLLAAAFFAGSGFHYQFSRAGVDIRALGFRLRSIHAADIQSYEAAPWSILGGYGIRGLGNRRAYVWGNRGVRIRTLEGEVFLGHSQPEKIVQDLNLITNKHEAREGAFHS